MEGRLARNNSVLGGASVVGKLLTKSQSKKESLSIYENSTAEGGEKASNNNYKGGSGNS